MEQVNQLYEAMVQQMLKSLDYLEIELSKLRAGKASTQMVEHIQVDCYGTMTPLGQVANISVPDSKTLSIQPWDKTLIVAIEKAIISSNIGLNPQNDGMLIRIFIPALTEERRKELVKHAQLEGEHAKVAIRNTRKDIMDKLKKIEKEDKLSEDVVKEASAEIQKITNSYTSKVGVRISQKENEILTI